MGRRGAYGAAAAANFYRTLRMKKGSLSGSEAILFDNLASMKIEPVINKRVGVGKVQVVISQSEFDKMKFAEKVQAQIFDLVREPSNSKDGKFYEKVSNFLVILYLVEYGCLGVGVVLQKDTKGMLAHMLRKFIGDYDVGISQSEKTFAAYLGLNHQLAVNLAAHIAHVCPKKNGEQVQDGESGVASSVDYSGDGE